MSETSLIAFQCSWKRRVIRVGQKQTGKRELIREAAVAVIAAEGYYAATTDRIAEVAGVSVGTIYNYFRNKEEILSFIFATEMENRIGWFKELIAGNLSPKHALREFLQRHFAAVAERPDVARILVRERSFSKGRDPQAVQGYLDQMPRLLEQLMVKERPTGRSAVDVEIVGVSIFGIIESLTRRTVETERYEEILSSIDGIVDMLWNGLSVT